VKYPKVIDRSYLSDLAQKIQKLPPDEAASLLFEGSAIILFAGFPEIAYQGFLKLTNGELKISEDSSLVHPLKKIIPALCYCLKIPCPAIFSQEEMYLSQLEEYIYNKVCEYEQVADIDRWFHIKMSSGNWSEDFLHDLTHPKVDITADEEKFKVRSFLQDLHRVISQRCINRGKWQESSRLLEIFEEVINGWKIEPLSYIEKDIVIFGIRTYFKINDIVNGDRYIHKWWQSEDMLVSRLFLVAYLPDVMKRISEGVLRNEINISQAQAQEFIESASNRTYDPQIFGFIPTVEDWSKFLKKWNKAIFDNLDERHIHNYEFQYANVLGNKSCLCEPVTEKKISELENRLQTKLPLAYKNFLFASNGFTILNEYCELYGTDRIKWFVEENKEWAEAWENDDEVDDEKYFQYGEHQDCIWVRGQYLKTALQISSTQDGYVYLLNPQIKDSRNEWEAWDFGNKLPGAYRYRSFWEMMQKVYERSFGS
jgi:hypothetical protein